MLVQWILNTIDPSIKKTLPYFEEAKPLWDVLKQRFDIGNGPRKQQIKKALAECSQPKHMSMAEYFGHLNHYGMNLLPTIPYQIVHVVNVHVISEKNFKRGSMRTVSKTFYLVLMWNYMGICVLPFFPKTLYHL